MLQVLADALFYLIPEIRDEIRERRRATLESLQASRQDPQDEAELDSDRQGLVIAVGGELVYISKRQKQRFTLSPAEQRSYERGGLQRMHRVARKKPAG